MQLTPRSVDLGYAPVDFPCFFRRVEKVGLTVKGAKGGVDGMKVDAAGHIYSVCPAGVCVLSAKGKLLGTISVPEQATDVAWGVPKHNVLYVTASTSVYRIQTRMVGVGSGLK